jgi:hypothetical protein
MTVVPANYRWMIVSAYPLVGLTLGLADPYLGRLAQALGSRPGVATAVSVNLLLPLAAVALGVAYARFWSVWLGALTMTLGFTVGLACQYAQRPPDGPLEAVTGAIHPILVAAMFGYAALGTGAVLAMRAWARRRG